MSRSRSSGFVVVPVGGRPPREPDATCEGCGALGTVGRATRSDAAGKPTEEHRFCARCWPEGSAFYRARWQEERRRASLAWRDRSRGGADVPPPASGMAFASATWHGTLELVRQLTEQVRHYREPPSREHLRRIAADIRASAAGLEGPMPIEVRRFLAEYGEDAG